MVAPTQAATRRHRIILLAAAGMVVVFWCLTLLGCGQQMDLPQQPETEYQTPTPGTFNLKGTWNIPSPSDLVTAGPYLFVIEENARVAVYANSKPAPSRPSIFAEYEGLIAPVHIAAVQSDSTFLVVADSGDMHCKIYYQLGGAPLYSFTDTLWQSFSGLAADKALRVYVADARRDTVQAYSRWGERLHVVADYGTGSGYVIDPAGLAHGGGILVVADVGKNWVQRLASGLSNTPVYLEPIGLEEDLLSRPLDVALESDGKYIHIADTGHDRVLKFTAEGAFRDTVYSPEKIQLDPPVVRPRFLCVRDSSAILDQSSLVFLSDPDEDRILLLELASF